METKIESGLIQLGLRENSFSRGGGGGGAEWNLAVYLQQREGLDRLASSTLPSFQI